MLKFLFIFILCLIPWYITAIVPVDYSYFDTLLLPFFTPPPLFYIIAWNIIYILIALSISTIINKYGIKNVGKNYLITLLINYLFNQSFNFLFFGLKNNFLGFISCLGTFISCLFLYQETSQKNENSAKLLDPYVILSLFASILSLTIYVINTL